MPEIEPQEEHYLSVIPEASQESIDDFIKSLEDDNWSAQVLEPIRPADAELQPQEDAEVEEEETDDEPVDPPLQTDPPPAADTDSDLFVTVRGQQVPIADIERLHEFDQFLRSNPDAAQRVQAAVSKPVVPEPAAPAEPANEVATPPEFLDLDDPVHKFLWEQSQTQQKELLSIRQADIARQQEEINRRAVADMDVALTRFRSAHPNFNDDQIESLRQHSASMNIIGAVMATTPDPVSALVRVLDLGAMDNEDLRTIYLAPPETPKETTQRQKSSSRKGKLNALGGSSGSVPRTSSSPRPMSDRDAIDQFAKELSDSFQQN
jgi:hypothetical protein